MLTFRKISAGIGGVLVALFLSKFFFETPAVFAAWGAFNDVWSQSANTAGLCGVSYYPCSSQLIEPTGGDVTISVSAAEAGSPLIAGRLNWYWNEDIISYCANTYAGGVPALIDIWFSSPNEQNSAYPAYVNDAGPSSWATWEDPGIFFSAQYYFYPSVPGERPTSTTIGVACVTRNGSNIAAQATPPGNTLYRSYAFEGDAVVAYPDWGTEILLQLLNATTTGSVTSTGNSTFDKLIGEAAQIQYKWPWGYYYRIKDAIAYGYASSQSSSGLTLTLDMSTIRGGTSSVEIFSAQVMEDHSFEPDMFRQMSTWIFAFVGLYYVFSRVIDEVNAIKI